MKACLYFFALLLALPLQAAEKTPSWNELEVLIGKSIQDASVQKFVKSQGLEEMVKGDAGNFTAHDQSYSLNFEANRVDCIVLHVEPSAADFRDVRWTAYDADLPFDLKRLYARKDVIGLLGQPDISSGNFWQVHDYELRISFSKSTGLIQEMYIWKKSKSPVKKPG